MYRLLTFLFFVTTSHTIASYQDIEIERLGLTKLVQQQKIFHLEEFEYNRTDLLGDWKWNVKDKAKLTYFFWTDDSEKDYWFRAFMQRLKMDMFFLFGTKCVDRVANRAGKNEYYRDTTAINSAVKFVVFGTFKLAKTGDWSDLDLRLMAGKGEILSSDKYPALEAGSVLPLNFTCFEKTFVHETDTYPGICLRAENVKGMSYFDLLIRLCRFICDIPAENKSFSESLTMLLEARADYKKKLGL